MNRCRTHGALMTECAACKLTTRIYLCTLHGQPKRTCPLCHPITELPPVEPSANATTRELPKSYEERTFEAFARRVTITESCWIWNGGKTLRHYGVFCVRAWRIWAAHRYAYSIFNGPLDEDLVLDHLCKNTLCVNPRHLEQVTQQENALRGRLTKVCPHGVRGKLTCPDCDHASRRAFRIRNGLAVRSFTGTFTRKHTAVYFGTEMLEKLRAIAEREGHYSVSRVIRCAVIRQYQLDEDLMIDHRCTRKAS